MVTLLSTNLARRSVTFVDVLSDITTKRARPP